jgi:hypothetical protein
MAYIPKRPARLNLDLTCHACGHGFEQRVTWKAKWVYCPFCNSREVHCYGFLPVTTGKASRGAAILLPQPFSQEPLLAVK